MLTIRPPFCDRGHIKAKTNSGQNQRVPPECRLTVSHLALCMHGHKSTHCVCVSSKYHTQLANINLDEIVDLTAVVFYFYFINMCVINAMPTYGNTVLHVRVDQRRTATLIARLLPSGHGVLPHVRVHGGGNDKRFLLAEIPSSGHTSLHGDGTKEEKETTGVRSVLEYV